MLLMNVKREVSLKPIRTDGAAVFDDTSALRKKHTHVSNFGDEYVSYKIVGKEIWLPRNLYPVSDQDDRDEGQDVVFEHNFTPRNKDQKRVVKDTVHMLTIGESFILQAPTGWGKTVCACSVISQVGKKTLVITTKEDITHQWIDAFKSVCGLSEEDIGVWRGDVVPSKDTKVVVGLVQSLMKGTDRYPKHLFDGFGLVVSDECHRVPADSWNQAMFYLPAKLRLGLSATPERSDGKDFLLNAHIGKIRVRASQDVLPFDVVMCKTNFEVPMVNWYGKYQPIPHEPGRIMGLMKYFKQDYHRNMIAVNFVKRAVGKGRKVVVFADTVAHINEIERMFEHEGLDYGLYIGSVSKADREKAKEKSVMLATYKMMSEGSDIASLDTLVMLTPKSDVRQIIGRIRREHPDKRKPLVLDLVDANSYVLKAYANKRKRWYNQMGSSIYEVAA